MGKPILFAKPKRSCIGLLKNICMQVIIGVVIYTVFFYLIDKAQVYARKK
jgi:hypothetical protein